MNLFLLLTALLSALAGTGRTVEARASAAVEASRMLSVAEVATSAIRRVPALRPDGYVAPAPLRLDLRMALAVIPSVTPERRRE